MFDAEKLLGKVLSGVSNSHFKKKKKYKKKKYKQKHRSDDLVSGIAGKLMSGKGLLTAVGLGVGAYAMLKSNQTSANQQAPAASYPKQPLPNSSSPTPPPPPPMPEQNQPPKAQTVSPVNQEKGGAPSQLSEQDLALNMIQVMIAAAHADGSLDSYEEKQILTRLKDVDLSQEEKSYILSQFHQPKSIDELTVGINDPQVAQAAYSLAVSSIEIDTDAERLWLDQLAAALNISKEMQDFIEE